MIKPHAVVRRIFCTLFLLLANAGLASEIPRQLEPEYQRAVISFNSGKFDESLAQIEALSKEAPGAIQLGELKALNLKAKQKDDEALKVYGDLARVAPPDRKARYYYEIASILYRRKRISAARMYFNASIAGKFNEGASHYFLGLIDYEDKHWDHAERHFLETLSSRADDLKPMANFYLGLIYFKTGHLIGAIRGLRATKDSAERLSESSDAETKQLGEELYSMSKKLLRTVDKSRWFGSLTLSTQYDNNVLLLPDSVNAPNQTAGKRSLKEIFTGGAGFLSSPARPVQVVASYRTFFNYNFNGDAKTYEFFSHLPSVYLNYKPYLRFSGGLKLDGAFTFQNQAGRDAVLELHPYSLTGDLGPYLHYEQTPHLFFDLETSMRPKKYYNDPDRGNDRRSGSGYFVRTVADYSSPWELLNPRGYLSYETDDANGSNWDSTTWGVGLSNLFKVSRKDTAIVGIDLAFPRFESRVPKREDTTITFRASWAHLVTRNISVLLDLNYTRQNSTIAELFSYNRAFGGAGVNFSF